MVIELGDCARMTVPGQFSLAINKRGFFSTLKTAFGKARKVGARCCWMHKTGKVLNYLPKRTQLRAPTGSAHPLRRGGVVASR